MNGRGVREARIAALSGMTAFFALLPWTAFADDWYWYIWPLMYSIVGLVVISGLARWLHMPRLVVALAQLVVAFEATWIGVTGQWLPMAQSASVFASRMDAAVVIARAYAAPVPHNISGLMPLMMLLGIGIAVTFDLIATTMRRPGLAGLLLLAVQTTTGALVDQPLSWGAFVLSALAFGALLASVREAKLIGWTTLRRGEREVGGQATEDFNTRTASLRIGLVAVALAVLAPLIVPLYGSGTIAALKADTGSNNVARGVGLNNMFLDMKKNLVQTKTVGLVQVSSTRRPSYFRIGVLDHFDGNTWSQGPRDFVPLTSQVSPDGLTFGDRGGDASTFQVTTLDSYDATTLPVPYPPGILQMQGHPVNGPPTGIQVDQNTWEIEPSTDNGSAGDFQFTTSQYQQDIKRPQLNTAPEAPAAIAQRYTQLPADLPAWVKATADKVAAGGTTKYQKALLLQDWFRSSGGFTYSLQSGTGSGLEQLHKFVSDNPADRVGYCEQFSTAMALFGRELGIPSRVVVGFLNPQASPQGGWLFTTKDLHAWPEMYFAGVGWVRFEPTPSARTGTALEPYQRLTGALGSGSTPPPSTYRVTPTSIGPTATEGFGSSRHRSLLGIPLTDLLWVVLILLLGVLGGLPRSAAWAVRNWRRQRAVTARARTENAWREVLDLAEDLGFESVSAAPTLRRTAQEFTRELTGSDPVRGPIAAVAVSRLAQEVETARYAPDYEAAETLDRDWDASLKGLDACASPRQRRRATWWPLAVFRRR